METITTEHAAARFKLGEWCIEPSANRIVSAHARRMIEPRQMDVLLALVRAPDQVLSKSQLLDAVWPHRFVVDGVLKRAVSQLRQALGDDARAPRYIQTVYKVGYRLLLAPKPWIVDPGNLFSPAPYNMIDVAKCMTREALCASARSTSVRP